MKKTDRIQGTKESFEKMKARGLNPHHTCVIPFCNIILEPNGKVGLCRHKGTEFNIGDITKNSIWEIWNGPEFRKIRREFLDGELKTCAREFKDRHCHLCPENNRILDDVEFKEIQDRPPLRLTANFNGRCNLQCQMCHVWKLPNGLYDEINFWGPATEHIFPHLKEIDLLSGEPFIQKDTYRLIHVLSEVNPDCLWQFTTNCHWKFTPNMREELNKIRIKNIIVSIDSLRPETYSKIRYPGNLDLVLKSLDELIEYSRSNEPREEFEITLNFLVQKDNWEEVPDVLAFCQAKGIQALLTFLYEPEEFSLLSQGEDFRKSVLDKYFESLNASELLRVRKIIHPLIASLDKLSRAYYLDRLRNIEHEFSTSLLA